MVCECDVCSKLITENTYYYSLNLNYEKFEDDGITIGTSNSILVLCDKCIDELPLAKILSYGARTSDNNAHDNYEAIKAIFQDIEKSYDSKK